MSPRLNRHAASVTAALYQNATYVKPRHASAWDAVLRNGAERPARVRLDEDWLQLEVQLAPQDLPAAPEESLWPLLERNAFLPPGLKLAVAVGDAVAPPVRLYAETMLDDAAEPAVRVRGLISAIQAAAHQWPSDSASRQIASISAAAAAACRATDWPMVERDDRIFFELDIPDGFAQAHVVAGASDGVNLVVDIGDDGATREQRAALALLLLRATAHVRLVRAAAGTTARLEVTLWDPVSMDAMRAALCALSIAYRLVAREATALAQDAALAAAYLRCSARSAGVCTPQL